MENLSTGQQTIGEEKASRGQLLKEKHLAKRWQVSPKTLRNDRASEHPRFPFVKIGSSVRYRLSDIEAYEVSHTIGSTSEGRL